MTQNLMDSFINLKAILNIFKQAIVSQQLKHDDENNNQDSTVSTLSQVHLVHNSRVILHSN